MKKTLSVCLVIILALGLWGCAADPWETITDKQRERITNVDNLLKEISDGESWNVSQELIEVDDKLIYISTIEERTGKANSENFHIIVDEIFAMILPTLEEVDINWVIEYGNEGEESEFRVFNQDKISEDMLD